MFHRLIDFGNFREELLRQKAQHAYLGYLEQFGIDYHFSRQSSKAFHELYLHKKKLPEVAVHRDLLQPILKIMDL